MAHSTMFMSLLRSDIANLVIGAIELHSSILGFDVYAKELIEVLIFGGILPTPASNMIHEIARATVFTIFTVLNVFCAIHDRVYSVPLALSAFLRCTGPLNFDVEDVIIGSSVWAPWRIC